MDRAVVFLFLFCLSYGGTVEGTQCYSCDSGVDLLCATEAIKDNKKECPGKCAVGIVTDTTLTLRGCEEDLSGVSTEFEACEESLCNSEIFPQFRFLCHQCSGQRCVEVKTEPLACSHYQKGDECYYAMDPIQNQFVRGCISDPGNSCEGNPNCVKCLGTGCNDVVPKVTQRVSCFSCDSDSDEDCEKPDSGENCDIGDLGTCSYKTIENGAALCYTHQTPAGVVRGCVKDLTENLQGTVGYNECIGDKCNKECIKSKVLSCAVCDSSKDINCINSATNFTSICEGSCHTCTDDAGHVTRGCGAKSDEKCTSCEDNNCNTKPASLNCYSCNSTESFECGEWSESDKVNVQVCPVGETSCAWRIEGDSIRRGCKSEFEDFTVVPNESFECSDSLCNGGFVQQKMKCHTCSSKDNDKCIENVNDPSMPLEDCPAADDTCVWYVEVGVFHRGCKSSHPNFDQAGVHGECHFPKCSSERSQKVLECYECNSKASSDCFDPTGSDQFGFTACGGEKDACVWKLEKGVMFRGCRSNFPDFTVVPGESEECCTSKCNNQSVIEAQKCASCNSIDNPKCLNLPDGEGDHMETCKTVPDTCVWKVELGVLFQGCKSSFENFTLEEGVSGECNGSHCFEEGFLSNPVCYSCDSKDSPKCEGNPAENDVFPEICPIEDDSCVWKIEDRVLWRGCKSRFENFTVVEGYSGECNESRCNDDVYDLKMKCFTCNSQENAGCMTDPNEENSVVEVCENQDDTCVWKIADGVVHRGCKGRFPDFVVEEGTSGECTNPLCNNEHIQKTRLGCYQCDGPDCLMSPGEIKICKNYQKDDKCFTDVRDDQDMSRGCMSDELNCQSKYCRSCNSFGCNSDPGLTKFSCASCRSFDTDDCVRVNASAAERDVCLVENEVFCHHKTLFGHSEKCFTYHDLDIVIRGCSKDMPKKIKGSKKIVECFDKECNRDCISGIRCAVCDSRTDPKCKNDVDQLELQECSLELSSCHTCNDENGTVIRGCGSGLENNLQCSFCQGGNGCNNDRQPVSCYTCDSRYDPNCAKWEHEADVEECPHPDDECIWRIAAEYTMRGCSSKVRDCTKGDGECGSCREDKCNGGVKPENRILCHQCEGSGCVDKIGVPVACEYYKPGDKCFTGIIDEGNVVRGCLSDKIDRCLSLDKCYICSVTGCNRSPFVAPFFQKTPKLK